MLKCAELQDENPQHSPTFKMAEQDTLNDLGKLESHLLSPTELSQLFETDVENGLSGVEAARRLIENGPNILTPPKKTSEFVKFLKTMFTGFAALLWVGSVLCLVAYIVDRANSSHPSPDNLYIGIALVFVVLISGFFTYYQERKSGKLMESFSKMVPPKATVMRNGQPIEIEVTEIVLGDIVSIKGGDKVPADIVILTAHALKVRFFFMNIFKSMIFKSNIVSGYRFYTGCCSR